MEDSLVKNQFHPLNFFIPTDLRQVPSPTKDFELFSFYSESQQQHYLLKVLTDPALHQNE